MRGAGDQLNGRRAGARHYGLVVRWRLDVAVGGTVTFTNNASDAHDMDSNPHPVHTDCPALNVGNLRPGESRASQALTSARSCGFHDHNNPGTGSLMGTITIR